MRFDDELLTPDGGPVADETCPQCGAPVVVYENTMPLVVAGQNLGPAVEDADGTMHSCQAEVADALADAAYEREIERLRASLLSRVNR